jgi:hypothetical protein
VIYVIFHALSQTKRNGHWEKTIRRKNDMVTVFIAALTGK